MNIQFCQNFEIQSLIKSILYVTLHLPFLKFLVKRHVEFCKTRFFFIFYLLIDNSNYFEKWMDIEIYIFLTPPINKKNNTKRC